MRFFRIVTRTRRLFTRVLPLMRDGRVPLMLKFSTIFAAVLIVSPIDLFGDIPVLGWIDDAVLLSVLATLFVQVGTWLLQREGRTFAPVTVRARPAQRPMLPG